MSRPAFHDFMRQIGRRLLAQQLAKQAARNSMEQGHLASRLKRSAVKFEAYGAICHIANSGDVLFKPDLFHTPIKHIVSDNFSSHNSVKFKVTNCDLGKSSH